MSDLEETVLLKVLVIGHFGKFVPVINSRPSGLQRQIVRASSFEE